VTDENKGSNLTAPIPAAVVDAGPEEYVPLALRDQSAMTPKQLEKAQADEADRSAERGYRIGTWSGLPKYSSTFDQFETMDLGTMLEYAANHRQGTGVYGNSGTAPLTNGRVVPAKGKKKG
jgi:hypothetical protein